MDRGSRPWTLSHFRAHHTHSPRMVNSTSQFSRTRLDAMLHAYECNHANSYIKFSWFIHNYISYNSNNHVNTSIWHASTFLFSTHQTCYSYQAITCKQFHMENFSPKSVPDCEKQSHTEPRTVPSSSIWSYFLGFECMAIPDLITPKPFSWIFRQE